MINCDQLSVNRLVLAKAVKAAQAMVPPQAMMQNRSNAQPTAAMQTKSNLQNQQAMNKQTPDEKYRLPKNQEEAKAMRNGTQYSSKVMVVAVATGKTDDQVQVMHPTFLLTRNETRCELIQLESKWNRAKSQRERARRTATKVENLCVLHAKNHICCFIGPAMGICDNSRFMSNVPGRNSFIVGMHIGYMQTLRR